VTEDQFNNQTAGMAAQAVATFSDSATAATALFQAAAVVLLARYPPGIVLKFVGTLHEALVERIGTFLEPGDLIQ